MDLREIALAALDEAAALDRGGALPSEHQTDLQRHDEHFHRGGFDPLKETCKFRDNMKKGDKPDFVGNGEEDSKSRAKHEYAEVIARYTKSDGTKKDGWMKAPNGEPTNLTERQWVQVRTPSFKKWFGDWEKAEITKRWFDIVPISQVEGLDVIDISEAKPLADKKAIAEEFERFGIVSNNRDGRKVRFPHNTAGKLVWQRRYASSYDKLFEGAVRAWSEKENPVEGHKDHTSNIKSYHHYINKFKNGEGEFFVHFTVRESISAPPSDKNLVHDAEVSDIEVYNTSANLAGTETGSLGAADRGHKPHADRKIAYFLSGVNPGHEDCSKIVDENGEPLVVFHGSEHGNFRVFDKSRIGERAAWNGRGFYFSDKDADAKMYGETRAFFLDMRNPFDAQDYKSRARKPNNFSIGMKASPICPLGI